MQENFGLEVMGWHYVWAAGFAFSVAGCVLVLFDEVVKDLKRHGKLLAIIGFVLLAGCGAPTGHVAPNPIKVGHLLKWDNAQAAGTNASMQPSGNYSYAFGGSSTETDSRQMNSAQQTDQNSGSSEPAHLGADMNRSDIAWGEIYLRADMPDIHYNLNQPAKQVDSVANNWSLVFAPWAPFRDDDELYFCGPVDSFDLQIYDLQADLILYDGVISGVLPCA